MDVTFLLRGLVIGLSIAAPVGPIGVLCMRRTLTEGRAFGFVSGLGTASADLVYGCIAGFGLSFISTFLVGHQLWLRLIGGAFLCYLGIKTLLAKSSKEAATAKGATLIGAYGSTFLLTLANPMTILSFAAVFAGLGLAVTPEGFGSATILVTGVFLGSSLWWLTLSSVVGLVRHRIDLRALLWVNRVSGAVVIAFGLFAVASALPKV